MSDRESMGRSSWRPSMWMREASVHLVYFAEDSERREAARVIMGPEDMAMAQLARAVVFEAEQIRERRGLSPLPSTDRDEQ